MIALKKVLRFLKRPNGVFLAVIYPITLFLIAGALFFLITGNTQSIIAYILDAAAAICLGYSVYTVVIFAPSAKKRTVAFLKNNRLTAKMANDCHMRAIVFVACGLAVNIGYALFNGAIALIESSVWFGSLAGYYFLLGILRGSVVLSDRKGKDNEIENAERIQVRKLKAYRGCGIVLLITILVLSVAVAQMVDQNQSFKYAGLMIYAGAAYTFAKVIIAIVNFIRSKKRKDITVETIQNIGLADAAVSLLALQTAMFQAFAFGENTAIANAVTGAAVCLLILGLGIFMIIKASVKLKKIKRSKQ